MMSRFMLCLLVAFLAIDCLHGKKDKDVMNKSELTAAVRELRSRMDAWEAVVSSLDQSSRTPLTSCPTDWATYQTSCYGVGTEKVTWAEAQEFCAVYGGRLAEVDDSAENTFVKNVLKSKGLDLVWLGGTDIFDDGQWKWASTGQALGFTDFETGQATQNAGGSEDCMVAAGNSDYRWQDLSCTYETYFICEVKLA